MTETHTSPSSARPSAARLDGNSVDDDFEEFVVRHASELVGFARRLAGDHHRGEDLVQSALARCYRNWSRIVATESARAYVYRAVVNEAKSWWRLRWSQEIVDDGAVRAGRDDTVLPTDWVAERDVLWPALLRLTTAQRAVLVMRYYLDAADEEIATTLDIPPSTVRSHARRGLSRLRTLLTEQEGSPIRC